MNKFYNYFTILILSIFFTACGGGGDNSVINNNNTPIITSESFNIDENQTAIDSIIASDEDNDSLTFSILDGDDKDKFNITSSGVLSFKQKVIYASPIDSDTNNVYLVQIQVSDGKDTSSKLISIRVQELISNAQSIISTLNNLRKNSGMISLKDNSFLKISAKNHANYLIEQNISGHYETNTSSSLFTGEKPYQRALSTGYKSRSVSENLSGGQETELLSLDGLMGAIYHRFGFLAFDIDEIGYDKNTTTYVYNMGNIALNSLCAESNFTSSGTYYENVCSDSTFRIQASKYDNVKNTTINSNPSYVIYPYSNQTSVTPVFYEESPDPLPNHSVSGYPISIEFNKNDFNMSKFTLNSFILKDNNSNIIDLVTYNDSTNIMKKSNDVNSKMSEYQFTIFPEKRLDFNTSYNINFDYTYDGNNQNKKWLFTTKTLNNLIQYNDTNVSLELDKTYYIYFKPNDKNETINTYSISNTFTSASIVDIQNSLYDKNTLKIKLIGSGLLSAKITLNGPVYSNKEININIIK